MGLSPHHLGDFLVGLYLLAHFISAYLVDGSRRGMPRWGLGHDQNLGSQFSQVIHPTPN